MTSFCQLHLQAEMVSMLIGKGADLIDDDDYAGDYSSDGGLGRTLLGHAACRGHTEVVKLLLPHVDIDHKDSNVSDRPNSISQRA